jgi:hypothetical protein
MVSEVLELILQEHVKVGRSAESHRRERMAELVYQLFARYLSEFRAAVSVAPDGRRSSFSPVWTCSLLPG